jgi:hypothetical protein
LLPFTVRPAGGSSREILTLPLHHIIRNQCKELNPIKARLNHNHISATQLCVLYNTELTAMAVQFQITGLEVISCDQRIKENQTSA